MAALAAMELRLLARRAENVLVTLVVPPAVLLLFASTGLVPTGVGRATDFLVPGALALAIIAAAFVNLGIATAFERSYGVLKRLGGAPISPLLLVAAKVVGVLALVVVQVVVLVAVAVAGLGWSAGPGWSPALAVLGIALGTWAFAALGLLLAGTLRAEAVLALANGLFLIFLMLGGIVLPIDHLPSLLQPVAAVLPATALADVLRIALTGPGDPAASVAVLAAWAVLSSLAAARSFRWD